MLARRLELLQGMPIFGALREDTLDGLLEGVPSVARGAGMYFFREGDRAHSLFVLERGSVDVLKRWQHREWRLHRFGAGNCFGEMALIDLSPRSASVRAVEDCVAFEIDAGALHRVFERDAEQFALIQMNLARELCRRLRMTDELLFKARMEVATEFGTMEEAPFRAH
jgi:CRP/FNR family cyclic AMP-dependent transcriptional regulator